MANNYIFKRVFGIEDYINQWLQEHQQYAILIVLMVAFLEAFVGIGLFVSGVILLSVCTLLYVEQILSLQQMLPTAFCGALLSDHSGYYIGRFVGPKFHETRFAMKRADLLSRAQRNVRRYGIWAIFIGRFLTPIRSVVPLLTGVSGMSRVKYSLCDITACAFWSACLGMLVVGFDELWS